MGLHIRTHVIQLPAGGRRSSGYANKLSIDYRYNYSVLRKRWMLAGRKGQRNGAHGAHEARPAAHAAAL